MKKQLYKIIASKILAIESCTKSNNAEWQEKHKESLYRLCNEYLPTGSGIAGSRLRLTKCTSDKLTFSFDYHHMRNGYYTHWTSHKVTVKPSLFNDIDITITKDGIRDYELMDYLFEVWNYSLTSEVEG